MKTFRRKGRQFLWMALCQKKAPGQRKLSITAKMHHLPSLTFVERNEILVPLENLIVSWEQHHLAWQKLMDKQDLTVPPLNLQQFPSLKMCWGISRTITDYLQVVWSLNVSENVWFFFRAFHAQPLKRWTTWKMYSTWPELFDVDASCILYVCWRVLVAHKIKNKQAVPTVLQRCFLCPRSRCKIWRTALAPYSLPWALAGVVPSACILSQTTRLWFHLPGQNKAYNFLPCCCRQVSRWDFNFVHLVPDQSQLLET